MPRRSDGRGAFGRLFHSNRSEPSSATTRPDHRWTVIRAVRALSAACRAEGRPLPAVPAVVIGSEAVWFRLSTPDERPPAGWAVDDQGRTWHTSLAWLQSANLPEPPDEPYPRLVGFGHTSQGFVLLNLGQAGGIIGLEGDVRQALALARRWTDELTTNPWSRGVPVVRVGFAPETAGVAGTVEAATLADAMPALADDRGGVLLLADAPGEWESEPVRALTADPAGRWSVIVVGRVEYPLWRLSVDSAGVVESALLDEPVLRRPAPPPRAHDDIPRGYPVEAADRKRGPLATRTRVIIASACAACLLVVAAILVSPTIMRAAAQDTQRSAQSASPSPSPVPTTPPESPTPPPSVKPSATPPPTSAAAPTRSVRPAATPGVPAGGTGEIRGVASGLCVDSDTNPAMALNGQPSGGHAFTNPCTHSPTELWQEGPLLSDDTPRAADLFRLVDQRTGFCMDSGADGSIYTLPCMNGDKFQVWQRTTTAATVAYQDEATNRCLTVSTTDGTLQTQPCPTGAYPTSMLFTRHA